MAKTKLKNVLLALLLVSFLCFSAAILLNIPALYRYQALPAYPSILLAQATLLSCGLCIYALYILVWQPVQMRNRLRYELVERVSKPWLNNKQWATRRVYHSYFGKLLVHALLLVNWWAAIWFLIFGQFTLLSHQPKIILALCGAVVLIGVVLLWRGLWDVLSWLRNGTAYLQILTLPGRPGDYFAGKIVVGYKCKLTSPMKISIVCFERKWSTVTDSSDGYSKASILREARQWFVEDILVKPHAMTFNDGHLLVPFEFKIPTDAPTSGACSDDAEVIWQVRTEYGKKSVSKYRMTFDVPVYC